MEKSFINHAPNGVTFPAVTQHRASDSEPTAQRTAWGEGRWNWRKEGVVFLSSYTVEDEAPAKLQTPKVFLVGLKISPHLP